MEDVAQVAFWLALACSGVATAAYWVHLLGLRVVVRRLATEAGEGPGVAAVGAGAAGGAAFGAGTWWGRDAGGAGDAGGGGAVLPGGHPAAGAGAPERRPAGDP